MEPRSSAGVRGSSSDFPFRDEGPVVLAGAVVEQALENGADGGFVGDAEVVELAQGRIAVLDRLVRWLQFQPLHGGVLHQCRGGRQCWFEAKWPVEQGQEAGHRGGSKESS